MTYANVKTGEVYEEGEIVEVGVEPTYSDLDDSGEEYKTPKQKRDDLRGEEGMELDALKACRRKTGCFATPTERTSFRKIVKKAKDKDDDGIMMKAWVYFKINQYKSMNSKGGIPKSFVQLMAGLKNEVLRDEWILSNRARVLAEVKKEQVNSREDEIYGE